MTVVEAAPAPQQEQSSFPYHDEDDFIERDGVRVYW